jgi:hypothetical protein
MEQRLVGLGFFRYRLEELQSSDVNNGGCAPPQPNTPPTNKVRGFFVGRR